MIIPNYSLSNERIQTVLTKLSLYSKNDHFKFVMKMIPYLIQKMIGMNPSFTDQYYRMPSLSLSISPAQGLFCYNIARAMNATRIVEFGTSLGYSTIYLASAVKDNGGGMVIGSELLKEKTIQAQKNLSEAGLGEFADIRCGDALQTLEGSFVNIDMILLDGSKDLYLPLLKKLFPYIKKGGIVLADNVSSPFIKRTLADYVAYVQNPANGFNSLTVPFPDGFEFSIKL